MARWDLLLTDARIATLRRDAADFGVIESGALAISDGAIAWVGDARELPGETARALRRSAHLHRCRWFFSHTDS